MKTNAKTAEKAPTGWLIMYPRNARKTFLGKESKLAHTHTQIPLIRLKKGT